MHGSTWILLADGRRARVLTEARRGAALSEHIEMRIGEEELYDIQDRPARAFDSAGAGRHAMDRGINLHEEEEKKFLRRVALALQEADKQRQFDHLILAAPPRALGLLREALCEAVRAKVDYEEAKDILDETKEKVRERLGDWRLPK